MKISGSVILKRKKDKPVRQGHPWIFSGAIARVEGQVKNGDLVRVFSAENHPLATGYINNNSQIRVRLLTWQDEPIDSDFWQTRITAAVNRRTLLNINATATRLIFGEADQLPGLVVDQYGDWLVMQCLTLGIDVRKEQIADTLLTVTGAKGIIERSDASVRRKEGLRKVTGVLRGDTPPTEIEVVEHGLHFGVNLTDGHKTGFYVDQRVNRTIVAQLCADKDVLNVFSYTGGFGVHAAAAGAKSVVNVDSSVEVLELAERNFERNGLQGEFIAADAFELLRYYRDEGQKFDVIVLDPPKFVNSQRDLKRAARGYKDINLLAFQLLRENGVLATFSCSGLVSADLYQKIVFGAVIDSGRNAQIIQQLTQAPDHPILLTFPESFYLKGLLCRVL